MIAVEQAPRVLVVHRQTIVGEALRRLLSADDHLTVVADARSVEAANVRLMRPDVLLLEYDGRDGSLESSVAACRAASPGTRILLLAAHAAQATLQRCLACGIDGYVLTDIDPAELRRACASVAGGEAYFDPRVAGGLLRRLQSPQQNQGELSLREGEIVRLIASGLSNREIGTRLLLSEKTVKNNISRIFSKLQITARTHAAVYAIRNGLA